MQKQLRGSDQLRGASHPSLRARAACSATIGIAHGPGMRHVPHSGDGFICQLDGLPNSLKILDLVLSTMTFTMW
jgi:hypothetical protein